MQPYNFMRVPGLGCPVCKAFIPTSIHELLTSGALHCPLCHLQLNIDRQHSDAALRALSKVDAAQQRVTAATTFKR